MWKFELTGCEIWSLTLREEHKLKRFENSVLTKIAEHKKEEAKDAGKIYTVSSFRFVSLPKYYEGD
jgi:hypothetical protein